MFHGCGCHVTQSPPQTITAKTTAATVSRGRNAMVCAMRVWNRSSTGFSPAPTSEVSATWLRVVTKPATRFARSSSLAVSLASVTVPSKVTTPSCTAMVAAS